MNNTVKTYLEKNTIGKSSRLTILPHQMASLDFCLRVILDQNDSVLMFHEMGSGKTFVALLFAILVSQTKEVIILLPNNNIQGIWKDKLYHAQSLLGLTGNLNNIHIMTITAFMATKTINGNFEVDKCLKYKNSIFIVDEAHNLFGNTTGKNLMSIKQKINVPFLLLTGSPINNTPKTVIYIIGLMTGQELNPSLLITQKTKIIHISLTEDGKKLLEDKLNNRISYYKNNTESIPTPTFEGQKVFTMPVILCPMEKVQEQDYQITRSRAQNEMFERLVINVSLCALGKPYLYKDVNTTTGALETEELMPNLKINNGVLEGKELTDLNISSKLKYFIKHIQKTTIKNPQKHLIYFSNATYGTFIIRNIMLANGISEYKGNMAKDAICFMCNTQKTCKTCLYITFSILTSKVNDEITPTLEDFNSTKNKKGHFLTLLFTSDVLSQSYTLNEVKNIWFFTIPDTYSQFTQIIGRAIRKFSYDDPEEDVRIRILAAVPKSYKHKTLTSEMSDEEIDKLPFDIKKQYYLELKSTESDKVYQIFKNMSKPYSVQTHKALWEPMILELLRLWFKNIPRTKRHDSKFLKFMSFPGPTQEQIQEMIDKILMYKPQVINNDFGNCLLEYPCGRNNEEIITIPIILELPLHHYKIPCKQNLNTELQSIQKRADVCMIVVKNTDKSIMYKPLTGPIIKVNVVSINKDELKRICQLLGIDLDESQGHKRRNILKEIENKLKELQKKDPKTLYIEYI